MGREGTVPSGGGTKARREGGREASVPIEGKWSHGRTQTDKKAGGSHNCDDVEKVIIERTRIPTRHVTADLSDCSWFT